MGVDLRRNVVLLNGRFLTRRLTGVDRFATEVVRALDIAISAAEPAVRGLSFELVAPKGRITEQFENIAIRQEGRFDGQAWEQLELGRLAGVNLLVNLCNTAPIFRRRQLSVIHDAATVRVPESYGRAFRLWYALLMPSIYRRSQSVCTVSEFSQGELLKLYGRREQIRVLPEGTDHMARVHSDASVLERNALGQRPYVLAVSSLSPHKNFATVIRAVESMGEIDFDVVIAGGQNPRIFSDADSELTNSVRYVGYVSDGELKALYENAACFVFPSVYEGYGLPPTEAMASGCPVLAARAASIPEVCGDAAVYFDPREPASLVSALRSVMGDFQLREVLRKKGLERAGSMEWRSAALGLVDEVRRVLA